MKNAILQFAGISLLGTGLVLAQNPSFAQRSDVQPHAWRQANHQGTRGLDRLSAALNLSADQQQQARSIMSDTRQQMQPLMQQMRQSRQSLLDAVKNGKSAEEIDRLAQAQAPLMAQMTALRTKAFARFYATLNADQKTKLDSMAGHAGSLFMHGKRG